MEIKDAATDAPKRSSAERSPTRKQAQVLCGELGSLPETYRDFLRALFENKTKTNPRFSFRRFAEIVGFKSPNYLQLILSGKRSLSTELATRITENLKLNSIERDYFLALVRGENANANSDSAQKTEADKLRLRALKKVFSKVIPAAQRDVLRRWHHLLIRELFLLPNAKFDGDWVSQMLCRTISVPEAENSLRTLVSGGFLKREGDKTIVVEPVLRTDDENLQAHFMRRFHAGLLEFWARNLDRLGPKNQELGVLNIPIHSSKIPELRRRIQLFQDEIVGLVQTEKEADCVVQLGTYLIPYLSEPRACAASPTSPARR